MRPAPFSYLRPARLVDALNALGDGAVPLAGGQSLLQAMRLREREPEIVMELASVAELDNIISVTDEAIRIGALATHRQLLEQQSLLAAMPWLGEAAETLGDVQVRNRGTVLGNLCWADPRANMAVSLLASGASVTAVDVSGDHCKIPLERFFTGHRRNALKGQLATEILLPRAAKAHGTYLEFSRQRNDLALVNVAAVNSASGLNIAVGGIHATPVRLCELDSANLSVASISEALSTQTWRPPTDHYGDAEYKLALAGTLVRRALSNIGVQVDE